jgi:hypothetical protein
MLDLEMSKVVSRASRRMLVKSRLADAGVGSRGGSRGWDPSVMESCGGEND